MQSALNGGNRRVAAQCAECLIEIGYGFGLRRRLDPRFLRLAAPAAWRTAAAAIIRPPGIAGVIRLRLCVCWRGWRLRAIPPFALVAWLSDLAMAPAGRLQLGRDRIAFGALMGAAVAVASLGELGPLGNKAIDRHCLRVG